MWENFRIPVGSLFVDISLVVAVIWWGASMTENLADLSQRVDNIERSSLQTRLAVLEREHVNLEKDTVELKKDIIKRLDRIEGKIERYHQ